MRKKDLADVCNYMKTIVIPEVPEDFIMKEPFRHGLADTDIRAGISAFRTFLYALYDKLAACKDKFDVETGRNFAPDTVDGLVNVCFDGSVHKCFPIINDLAVILFNLSYRGKLNSKQEHKLILTGIDLITPFDEKNEKHNSLINIAGERKAELFGILNELGFTFEGLDVEGVIDFSKIKTFTAKHENQNLLIGMKLLAEAMSIKKTPYCYLSAVFMRCDFYPPASKHYQVYDLNFNLFLKPHPLEIKEWIIQTDKILTGNSCSVAGEINNFNLNMVFTYTSRITNKQVCKIHIGIDGCKAYPYGHHLNDKDNILASLPESMRGVLSDGKHECTGCATKRPDLVEHNVRYTLERKAYIRCHNKGFGFTFEKAEERETIEKWIVKELAWS